MPIDALFLRAIAAASLGVATGLVVTPPSIDDRWFVASLLGVAMWGPVWFVSLMIISVLGEKRRLHRHLCPNCGYDLRSDFTAGCPECGWGRDRES